MATVGSMRAEKVPGGVRVIVYEGDTPHSKVVTEYQLKLVDGRVQKSDLNDMKAELASVSETNA
jgi:hypothetical protein